jgi:hypothetical protein
MDWATLWVTFSQTHLVTLPCRWRTMMSQIGPFAENLFSSLESVSAKKMKKKHDFSARTQGDQMSL